MSFDPQTAFHAIPTRYALLKMLIPATGKAIESSLMQEVQLEGTRVVLALEIHRSRHGEYPRSLAELAPAILPEVPPDPVTGGLFGYRLLAPGEDPAGRPYVLYSFGNDHRDDGGRTASTTKIPMSLRDVSAGLDYVINVPRPPQPETENPEPAQPEETPAQP